jgi:SAM-dependent methyltransferase
MKNIKYNTKVLSETYSLTRTSWDQFYDSEKVILEKTFISKDDSVLDLGCGCGGLGFALMERFGNKNYTGIDINEPSINRAKDMNLYGDFYCGDILDTKFDSFVEKFDKVISFSCVDWNVEFTKMFQRSWDFVKPGGSFIVSLRLTKEKTLIDFENSFQEIDSNFKAQYVVLNFDEVLSIIKNLNPSKIIGYGYWKEVIKSYGNKTVTPYDKLCFSVFSIQKKINKIEPTVTDLDLPI